MSAKTLEEFLRDNRQEDLTSDSFELENPHLLEVKLDGRVWAKAGSMVAYLGQIKFSRQGMREQGLSNLLKKAMTNEGQTLMKAEGRGRLYLADRGKKIALLRLNGESITVNGNDVIAYQDGMQADIRMMRKMAGMMAGGLFNVSISGHGIVAIGSHYEPLTLAVTPDQPVFTDPNATVAWSGNLTPDFVTDMSLGTLFGRTSGESIQMKFSGNGWVVVQPYEEVMLDTGGKGSGGVLDMFT